MLTYTFKYIHSHILHACIYTCMHTYTHTNKCIHTYMHGSFTLNQELEIMVSPLPHSRDQPDLCCWKNKSVHPGAPWCQDANGLQCLSVIRFDSVLQCLSALQSCWTWTSFRDGRNDSRHGFHFRAKHTHSISFCYERQYLCIKSGLAGMPCRRTVRSCRDCNQYPEAPWRSICN